MKLALYTISDADNVINKTLGSETEIDIYLKADTDVSAPRIILIGDDFSDFNYAEIVDLNRFYFIRSVTNIGGKRWELVMECDVIETYKIQIMASNARFSRNIKNGDYFNASLDNAIMSTVTTVDSNKSLPAGDSMILSSVGAK